MATTATITIGSVSYTVYSLTADPVQDADDYLAARIGSTWATATTLQKQQALVSAARMLDRAVAWSGTKTVAAQALEWPRDGAVNGCTSDSITDGTIPDGLALAEFELANILFGDATVQDNQGTGSNVKRVKAGSAEVEFFSPTIETGRDTRLPTVVNDLVKCFVQALGSFGGGSFGTGTDQGDVGYCKDEYDRYEGYP